MDKLRVYSLYISDLGHFLRIKPTTVSDLLMSHVEKLCDTGVSPAFSDELQYYLEVSLWVSEVLKRVLDYRQLRTLIEH